jgi:hypothetical protein
MPTIPVRFTDEELERLDAEVRKQQRGSPSTKASRTGVLRMLVRSLPAARRRRAPARHAHAHSPSGAQVPQDSTLEGARGRARRPPRGPAERGASARRSFRR